MQRQRLATLQAGTTTSENFEQQDQATASALQLAQKMPTFGFDNLVADWTFLQFLQYFGDSEVRTTAGYNLSPEFFEVIIAKDPFYRQFYLFLSGSVSNFAAQPQESVNLIADGLAHLSPTLPNDSFYIWRYKAIDELLFLGDGAAARQSFQTAADWASQSDHPDAELMVANSQATANFLARNPDSKMAQVNAWAGVLSNALDDATRQQAIDRINALGGEVIIENGAVKIRFPEED
ncbi:MAG: hypothetical protein WA939_13865 [Nodosilinea sp.]